MSGKQTKRKINRKTKIKKHDKKPKTRHHKHRSGGNAGCGSCGCPIAPLSVADMNKFVPNFKPQQGGLNAFKYVAPNTNISPAPVPGPFVGNAWGSNVSQWPGVDGIGGDRNYNASYANVLNGDPTRQMQLYDTGSKMFGGRKKRSTRKKYKGGSNLGTLLSKLNFNA